MISYALPKPQRAVTPRQRKRKRQLEMCLHRARCKAVTIEGEELLNDPSLADEPDKDTEAFEQELINV